MTPTLSSMDKQKASVAKLFFVQYQDLFFKSENFDVLKFKPIMKSRTTIHTVECVLQTSFKLTNFTI